MSFTEVTNESWFSRLMNSIKGVVVGFIMILVSFVLLFWNEGRAVHREQVLSGGKKICVDVAADKVDAGNDGKLVHLTGEAKGGAELSNAAMEVEADPGALQLRWTVEMYQWEETKESKKRKKLGGGEETVTTYDYKKEWSDKVIDSGDFKEKKGHTNPNSMPYDSGKVVSEDARLGAFKLPVDIITGELRNEDKVSAKDAPEGLKVNNGQLYQGKDPSSPAIGDVRVSFSEIKAGTYSLVAQQKGDSFQAYPMNGDTILYMEPGTKSKDEMFGQLVSQNNMMTWILRLVGFVLMWIGLAALAGPFTVFLDVIPLLGDLAGLGVGLFAFFIAAVLSLTTIAIGWIVYRPLLGILLLAAAGGLVFMGVKAGKAKRG